MEQVQVIEKTRPQAPDEASERLAALMQRRRDAIRRAFTRLHPLALGCAMGVTCGLAALGATLVLALRGGPEAGPLLKGLSSYFPGYRVDVVGSFVGGGWALAAGFVGGWAIAKFRNLALQIVLAWARFSADRWRRRHMLDEI